MQKCGKSYREGNLRKKYGIEKRNLVNLVFANLELKPEKLDFILLSALAKFIKYTKSAEWHAVEDSNL